MHVTSFLFVLCLSVLSHAQRVDVTKSNTYVSNLTSDSLNKGTQKTLIDQGAARAGLQDLFGAEQAPFENNGLSWPPLPRFWWQEGYSDYLEGKLTVGLPPGVPAVTLNYTHSYKYEVTTVFHVLGSLKLLNRTSVDPLNELLPQDFERVFKRDYVTVQEFFNVSKENPMVGMCQFEIALYHGKSASGGISYVLGAIVDGGRVNFSRMTVYSRMFNIKPQGPNDEYSSSWYLNNECSDRFNKYTRAFVEDALEFKARQYNATFHPQNTCAKSRPVPNISDRDCKEWHESFWSRTKRESTVGRCEMFSNGESHCTLKSKEGQRCPMYYSDGQDTFLVTLEAMQNNTLPAPRPLSTIDQGPHTLATPGYREFPCDAGLTCTMDKSIHGTATCKNLAKRGTK
jgi:hypothetical protein